MNFSTDALAIQRLRNIGGAELVRQMVRLFLEHMPKRIAAATHGSRTGDWGAVERAGHSMKSSAAYLGLTGLAEQAALLEHLASGGRGAEVGPVIRDVSNAYPAFQTMLQEIVDRL